MSRRIEEQQQKEVALWLRQNSVFFTSSIAGVNVGPMVGKRLKDMGYYRGCPDLMIFEPRKHWHGLFIEMKTPTISSLGVQKGKQSPEQKVFDSCSTARGYLYLVCYGSDEAITKISLYLYENEIV